jgi:lipoyl(octanoyl) transferase
MSVASSTGIEIRSLGRRPYAEVLEEQKVLAGRRAAGETPDTILLVEHEGVYTAGTSAGIERDGPGPKRHNTLPFPLFSVERGGDITYHGPGQLVGYPVIHLKERGLLVGSLLRLIEEALIDAIGEYGLEGKAVEGKTGVWVGGKKIASIGIAVRGWVSYHGFSLNADCDLAPFSAIRPCGFDPEVMSSVSELTGSRIGVKELEPVVASAFEKRLQEASCIR